MKYKLFILTVLASVGFFNYHALLSEQIIKLLFYLSIIACTIYALYNGHSLRKVKYPRIELAALLGGIVLSAMMATAFHQQSIMVSFMTILPTVFAYFYFWVLLKMDLDSEKIMKIYLVLCAVASVVYFCNLATIPFNIFGEPIISLDMSRGVIRLPVVFIEFFPMIVFYAINKLILTKDRRWIIVIGVAAFMIFMSVIRQIIALTAILGLWFYFRRISFWKKLLAIVVAVAVVVFVLPQIPMYKTMIEFSEDQRDENDQDENIRITAWRYYTYENQTNGITPILGNGLPSLGNSRWGMIFGSDTADNGCFAADVGWAGFYWYFGAIATAALLIMLLKAAFKRKRPEDQYLTYWLVFLIITSCASGPILYYWQIIDVVVCLAMVYTPHHQSTSDTPISENDRTDNTKLQQRLRYPQLHRVDSKA